MGYITNQWLMGSPERNRYHFPVDVTIDWRASDGEWSRSRNVVATTAAVRSTGDYYLLYLQEADLAKVLPQMARRADAVSRRQIVHDFLVELDDAGLLEALSIVLQERMARRRA